MIVTAGWRVGELNLPGESASALAPMPVCSEHASTSASCKLPTPVHGLNAERIATAIDRVRVFRFHDELASTWRLKL
ncbi:MAG: hypothetical protein ACLP0J_19110 [Solirubrobacteraceae bacterium]